MKHLAKQELSLVSGGANNSWRDAWDKVALDGRQCSTIATMSVQALIAHKMPAGPAKSTTSIVSFAAVSMICNAIFA